jgi:hypothetical protein
MPDQEILHDFQPVSSADDVVSDFNPVSEEQPFNPSTQYKPEVGKLESAGRGAAQAFSLGYSPQIIAAIKTGNMPGSNDPAYLNEVAKQKAATDAAWDQHPWIYGTGMAASALPAAAASILMAPEEGAIGAASLLANSGNIGSLGGSALRTIAGESSGAIPSLLRGTAALAENPVAQGAVMGSAEGNDLSDKLSGAAAGAVGAKVAPAILGAAGNAVKTLGQNVAPKIVDPIVAALTGNPSQAQKAGSIANDLGISLSGASVSPSIVQSLGTKADLFNQVPKATGRTLNGLGDIINDYAGQTDRKDTGSAIRSAVQNWVGDDKNPTGFISQMNDIYKPVNDLSSNSQQFNVSNLQKAVNAARTSSTGVVSDIEPTLSVVQKALDAPNGLTFDQMHALRQVIDDHISFNQMPGSANLNTKILGQLRSAVSNDMNDAAQNIGGSDAVKSLANANKQASDLYNLRSSILKIVGNPNVNGPGSKTDDTIYRNIISGASKKGGGNLSDLENLKNVVSSYDPNAWASVGKAYSSDIAPNGQFSFNNFNRFYNNNLHDDGRDAIFGASGSGGIRDTFDKINNLGNIIVNGVPLGSKLDALGKKAGQDISNSVFWPEAGGAVLESMLFGGVPVTALTGATAGAAAGRFGARNIAAPLSQYVPSTGEKIVSQALQKTAPLLTSQASAQNFGPAAKGLGIYGGAKLINSLPPSAFQTLGLASQKFLPQQQQADGGRIERASGGRIIDHEAEADHLVRAAEMAKNKVNQSTEKLLNVPDEAIIKALDVAQQAI